MSMSIASGKNLGRILTLAAEAVPNHIAVTLGDEARTFQACDSAANRYAHALQKAGLERGDRLLFWSPISLESFDVFFATQRLGVTFVPVNPAFSVDEMLPVLEYIRPKALLVDAALAEAANKACEITATPLLVLGNSPCGKSMNMLLAGTSDSPVDESELADEDIHAIFLTSGSTGKPKGVMVSHRASWNRAFGGNSRSPVCGGRGEVNMFPLFHWAGWHFTLCAWAHRRAIHLTPRADADSLNAIIDKWQPRYMYAIPAIWERLLQSDGFGKTRSLRMVMTGTYRFDPQLIQQLRSRLPGIEVTIGMGATELGVGLQIGDDDIDRKPYSVGLPAPGVEAKIVDGELLARSDQMMSGYFDLPELTAETVQDGWYHTGDLAEVDDEGYITIVGRRKEVIRTGAEAVAPAEVEGVIRHHPAFREVSIVGLPSDEWGEIVCAVVTLEPGHTLPQVSELRAFIGKKLTAFKHPRRIIEVTEIPRTSATGQIQRSKIRDMVLALEGLSTEGLPLESSVPGGLRQ